MQHIHTPGLPSGPNERILMQAFDAGQDSHHIKHDMEDEPLGADIFDKIDSQPFNAEPVKPDMDDQKFDLGLLDLPESVTPQIPEPQVASLAAADVGIVASIQLPDLDNSLFVNGSDYESASFDMQMDLDHVEFDLQQIANDLNLDEFEPSEFETSSGLQQGPFVAPTRDVELNPADYDELIQGFDEGMDESAKTKLVEQMNLAATLGNNLLAKKNLFPYNLHDYAETVGNMLVHGFNDQARKSKAGRPSKHDHLVKTAVLLLFLEQGKINAKDAAAKANDIHRCGRSNENFKPLVEKTLRQRCTAITKSYLEDPGAVGFTYRQIKTLAIACAKSKLF